MNKQSRYYERLLKRQKVNGVENENQQHCPNPDCPFSSPTYLGLRTHVGKSGACKAYEAAQLVGNGNMDANDDDNVYGGGMGDGMDGQQGNGDEELHQPRQYEGPLPHIVEAFETSHGDSLSCQRQCSRHMLEPISSKMIWASASISSCKLIINNYLLYYIY